MRCGLTVARVADLQFISTFDFWWRVVVVTMASCVPVYLIKIIHRKLNPPTWTKLRT